MSSYCFTCGGHGFKDRVCPECGRSPESLNLHLEPTVQKFVDKTNSVRIPQAYVGVVWNKEMLLRSHNEVSMDPAFQMYATRLENLHNIFISGKVPEKSAFISAPATCSKEIFAYSCMQFALQAGLTVAPILDNIEAKRLLCLASENFKYKLYGSIDYDSYMMSDIVFLTVTKTAFRNEASTVFLEMLDRRSRLGKPTFIICRYGIKTISSNNNGIAEFKAALDPDGNNNPLKYPVKIIYSDKVV